MTGHEQVLEALSAAVDAVFDLDLTGLPEAAVVEVERRLTRLAHRVPALQARVAGEIQGRNLGAGLGYRDPRGLLCAVSNLTGPQASARLADADLFAPRRALTGAPLPPVLPATAAGLAGGDVSPAHARLIAATIAALPHPARVAHTAAVDAILAENARILDTRSLRRLATRVVQTLDPDGPAPGERIHRRDRDGWLRAHPDGSGELWARLTPTALALLQTALTPYLRPRPTGEQCPDPRTPGQRFSDALEQLARHAIGSGRLPATAGVPTTLLVTLDLIDLERRLGHATTHHGGTLSVTEALRLAADANVIPVVLGQHGDILGYGRGRRFASRGQRRALTARDRGCCFPGCTTPAAGCQVHHASRDWAHGGLTDIDHLALVCPYHQNEPFRQGWTTTMTHGHCQWIPPPHIDPHQVPRHNPIFRP